MLIELLYGGVSNITDDWAADFLAAARKPASGTEIKEKESFSQLFQLKSLDRQETWYPTLRRTVWVLSQLHEFVKVRNILHSAS